MHDASILTFLKRNSFSIVMPSLTRYKFELWLVIYLALQSPQYLYHILPENCLRDKLSKTVELLALMDFSFSSFLSFLFSLVEISLELNHLRASKVFVHFF